MKRVPTVSKKNRPKIKIVKHDYVKAAVLAARDAETRGIYK